MKKPDPQYDGKGLIKNWSQLWPDARALEALVVAGCMDGKTAANIRDENPLFAKYAYAALASGLNNIRKKHNKEIDARDKHVKSDGECESVLFFNVALSAKIVPSPFMLLLLLSH